MVVVVGGGGGGSVRESFRWVWFGGLLSGGSRVCVCVCVCGGRAGVRWGVCVCACVWEIWG